MAGSALTRALALLLVSCASRSTNPAAKATPNPDASARSPSAPTTLEEAAPTPASPPEPTLLVTEPAVLAALESEGLGLAALLGARGAQNDELGRAPRFAPVLQALEAELASAAAADPLAGVDVARFSHRLFDRRFLRDARARFELAGVVSRPDRAPFHAESCGETRLIYRLRYALDAQRASKLPMTIGVELAVPRPETGCAEAAARWLESAASSASARAAWLRSPSGPLAPTLTALTPERTRVVVNVQLLRWPSTIRPDLGGHADYLLRAFRPDAGGVLREEALENTLDAAALRDPARRRLLLASLTANAEALDAGTLLLPDSLLAKRALSVTPRGLSRLANRPFTAALSPAELGGLDYQRLAQLKTPQATLRRLDQLSCQGCHEARSVAGFHLLGDDSEDAPENALESPVSPHVLEDLPRRLRIARQMLAGVPADFTAPFAERASADGQYGAHCSLGRDPSYASWTCAAGLVCSAVEAGAGEPIGQCLPATPEVGDACEAGSVSPHADRRRDRMSRVTPLGCGDMVCNRSAFGFPAGMCTASCAQGGAVCGAIAVLDPFNACLARGEPFIDCVRHNTRPAGLRACSRAAPCRDDYVCARSGSGGVCLPPYFVFQLRVDGHSTGLQRSSH